MYDDVCRPRKSGYRAVQDITAQRGSNRGEEEEADGISKDLRHDSPLRFTLLPFHIAPINLTKLHLIFSKTASPRNITR